MRAYISVLQTIGYSFQMKRQPKNFTDLIVILKSYFQTKSSYFHFFKRLQLYSEVNFVSYE